MYVSDGFIPGLAVAHHSGQRWHFCHPAAVFFAFKLNCKRHATTGIVAPVAKDSIGLPNTRLHLAALARHVSAGLAARRRR